MPKNITEIFLEEILGEKEGIAYVPTKDVKTGHFQQYFFAWPAQKREIITHLLLECKTKEVYLAPSLFKEMSSKKTDWLGSHFVWVEFDGNALEVNRNGIPEPTLVIQSSTEGHEHWYWKLKSFETDFHVIESLSRQLAYTLGADLSGWDAGQVLRPPGTRHHESGRQVRLTKRNHGEFGYEDFKGLKEFPKDLEIDLRKDIPEVNAVVAKYRMPGEVYEMFTRPTQPKGSRSSAMTRLAHHCVEMGMENEEVFSMLLDADERWGKFKTRPPEQRRQRLIGIIQHVRSKKSFESVLDIHNDIVIQTLGDFLDAEEPEINWVFDGLLAEQGLGTIASIPGVGKSTLSFQLAIKSTISHDFLKWANRKQLHAAVLSFEMQANECRPFMEHMLRGYSKEEVTYLRQNLGVWAYGSKFEFNNKEKRRGLLDAIDIKESKFIIIDSLKQIVTRMRDEELDEVYEFINKDLRKDRGCTVWIIHHLRKPANEGPRKPQDISDLYGDQYIGAFATSVLGLWKRSFNQVEVMNFKTRMAPETPPFVIERAQYLDFVITDNPAPENHSPVAKGGDNGEGNSEPSTGIGI